MFLRLSFKVFCRIFRRNPPKLPIQIFYDSFIGSRWFIIIQNSSIHLNLHFKAPENSSITRGKNPPAFNIRFTNFNGHSNRYSNLLRKWISLLFAINHIFSPPRTFVILSFMGISSSEKWINSAATKLFVFVQSHLMMVQDITLLTVYLFVYFLSSNLSLPSSVFECVCPDNVQLISQSNIWSVITTVFSPSRAHWLKLVHSVLGAHTFNVSRVVKSMTESILYQNKNTQQTSRRLEYFLILSILMPFSVLGRLKATQIIFSFIPTVVYDSTPRPKFSFLSPFIHICG